MKKTAIALQYPESAPAPFIAYKGSGAVAEKMLEIAKDNDVPVVSDSEVASVLLLHDIGQCVPFETYEVLAGIFAFLKKVREYDRN